MLNGEDGGNRRFILVNNDELTKGRGRAQKRICEEICLPRVRAAIDGYDYRERGRTVHVDGLPGNFRYYHVEVAGSGAERSGHGAPDVAWDEPVGQANQHT